MVDAPAGGVTGKQLVAYEGTSVRKVLDESNVNRAFATPITSAFDYLRAPIVEAKSPGIEYQINPRDYKLGTVADAYINLGH